MRLPRLHCCILELVLDEMCIAKCSLLTCEMGVQTAVLTCCVCRLYVQISSEPTVEPPTPSRVAPLSLSGVFSVSCLLAPARSGPLWETSGLCHLRLGEGVERCLHTEGAFAETGLRRC